MVCRRQRISSASYGVVCDFAGLRLWLRAQPVIGIRGRLFDTERSLSARARLADCRPAWITSSTFVCPIRRCARNRSSARRKYVAVQSAAATWSRRFVDAALPFVSSITYPFNRIRFRRPCPHCRSVAPLPAILLQLQANG